MLLLTVTTLLVSALGGANVPAVITENGGIVGVAAVAGMVFEEVTKPILESLGVRLSGDPAWDSTPVHDSVLRLYNLALSVVAVLLLMYAFVPATDRASIASAMVDVVIAWAVQFGLYRALRPVPVTPTADHVARVNATAASGPLNVRPRSELALEIAQGAQEAVKKVDGRLADGLDRLATLEEAFATRIRPVSIPPMTITPSDVPPTEPAPTVVKPPRMRRPRQTPS